VMEMAQVMTMMAMVRLNMHFFLKIVQFTNPDYPG
jgi:hypothetical protein